MTLRTLTVMLPIALAASFRAPAGAMPPDAERATQTLIDSPRHAEWVNVPQGEGEPEIRTWVVYPERADKAPVVIVIHEIFGLTDWVRAVADSLAEEGFIAVAPDLLSGMGPGGGGTESFEGDAVRAAIRNISNDEATKRLNAVRTWAHAQPAASDSTGCVGYCWGGSMTFLYATMQPELDAAVVYYGTAPTDEAALAKIAAPVLGLYGGDDARVTSTVAATEEAMKKVGKPFTAHTYEAAGHGFLRQQTGREGANEKAARGAWRETVAFFKKKLE